MFIPKLAEGESFVKGRSSTTARTLIEAVGAENVVSTSRGYVVTGEFEAGDLEVYTAADRPAVPTEPGTSTNVDEVHNVGQAATATATSESAADKDAEDKVELFDPSKATVDEVKDYLDGADATERERVLAAEEAGKGRKTILDLAEAPEGAK